MKLFNLLTALTSFAVACLAPLPAPLTGSILPQLGQDLNVLKFLIQLALPAGIDRSHKVAHQIMRGKFFKSHMLSLNCLRTKAISFFTQCLLPSPQKLVAAGANNANLDLSGSLNEISKQIYLIPKGTSYCNNVDPGTLTGTGVWILTRQHIGINIERFPHRSYQMLAPSLYLGGAPAPFTRKKIAIRLEALLDNRLGKVES